MKSDDTTTRPERECDLCGGPMGDEAGHVHATCADDEAARTCAAVRDWDRGGNYYA